MHIAHAMNVEYPNRSEYSIRSYYIALNKPENSILSIFATKVANNHTNQNKVNTFEVPKSSTLVLKKIYFTLLKKKALKLRSIWKEYDRALTGKIPMIGADLDIFHTWEWVPRTIESVKKKFANAKIVRDVVISRFFEYYSGTPITEENALVDYFFSPSSYTTKKLLEWGIPNEKIVEIPFGVDCEIYQAIPDDRKPLTPIRFCFSGGVSKRKGADTLLRVWRSLHLEDAELHFYGSLRDDVKSELYGLKNVVFHGKVKPEILVQELPWNHVFVFPSMLEGSAKVTYEALACGLPVITTPESGSVVRDGIEGYIIEKGDDEALAHAMKTLYEDAALRHQMGRKARERAEEYTWERYAKTVWQAYEKIANFH